jgi:uncharacterized cupin superfamily protein
MTEPARAWLRISDALLSGIGIDDPYDMEENKELFEWADGETGPVKPMHKLFELGRLLIDVVQSNGTGVQLDNFPNDEFLTILVGGLTLTTNETKAEQCFYAGDSVLIPKGWSGLWRTHPGMFREVAIVPVNFFDPAELKKPQAKGVRPRKVEMASPQGTTTIHDGTYRIESRKPEAEAADDLALAADEVVYIRRGNLTLADELGAETFKPGDFILLRKGAAAKVSHSAGYEALAAVAKHYG